MKLGFKFQLIAIGIIFWYLSGCSTSDCEDDKAEEKRLARVEKEGRVLSEFQYDEEGKLLRRVHFDDANEIHTELEFIYDELGNVLKQEYRYKNVELGVKKYFYEGGLVTKIVKLPQIDSSDVFRYETEISHNTNGDVESVKITRRVNWKEDYSEFHEYEVEKGNVMSIKSFYRDSAFRNSYDQYAESTFSYDKCRNPYKGKLGVYPIQPMYISCNNLIERIDDGKVVVSSTYKYQKKFPVQRTTTSDLFLRKETDVVYDYIYE